MPRAVEITTAAELPALGSIERETLDFKQIHASVRGSYECAKDVAALANYLGGTIIVGGVEDRATGTLVRYEPLSHEGARAARTDYENAVRGLCSPVPSIGAEVIPHQQGYVVAVNVRAHPERLIGVHRTGDGDFWTFPLRRATQTIFLMPEQLPMYADPQVRRALLLLHRVEIGAQVMLRVVRAGAVGSGDTGTAVLNRIDEEQNTVIFGPGVSGKTYPANRPVSFALDWVRTVFREPGDTQWRVVIEAL